MVVQDLAWKAQAVQLRDLPHLLGGGGPDPAYLRLGSRSCLRPRLCGADRCNPSSHEPMTHQLHHGDCLEVLRSMPDCSVDAIVTDPPYGLSFMGKKWDYDVPSVEVWVECLRVLKPGGHLLAFAGTRTQHRMAVRIEDAGFEIRDMIAWVYGSGFPKSLDVSKAIDKAAGAEREVVGNYAVTRDISTGSWADLHGKPNNATTVNITAPATTEAQRWQGWGTAGESPWLGSSHLCIEQGSISKVDGMLSPQVQGSRSRCTRQHYCIQSVEQRPAHRLAHRLVLHKNIIANPTAQPR